MLAQVQRLATFDEKIPELVVIDVTSLLDFAGSTTSFWTVVDLIRLACSRGRRTPVWVVAPRTERPPRRLPSAQPLRLVPHGFAVAAAARRLSVVYSREPARSLAYEVLPPSRPATLVTTAFSEPWALATRLTAGGEHQPIVSVLDIETGKLWRREDVDGSPEVAARAEAMLRRATRDYKEKYKTPLARQLDAGVPVTAPHGAYKTALTAMNRAELGDPLPEWFTTPWTVTPAKTERGVLEDFDAEEFRLLGWRRSSPRARRALDQLIAALPQRRLDTGYVCAHVRRGSNRWVLKEVVCRLRRGWCTADASGAPALLNELFADFPERWFGPRMIDLLAWMVGHRLPRPARAGDPAWSAFALDPEVDTDNPIDLAGYSDRVLGLPLRARAWLGDLRREAPAPRNTRELEDAARCGPAVDWSLAAAAGPATSLASLIRDDIEATIPTVAAIERRGVALGTPGGSSFWSDFDAALHGGVQIAVREARSILKANVDIFHNPKLTVRAIEKAVGMLPLVETQMRMPDLLQRYVEVFDGLEPIRRARSLGAFNRERPLQSAVASGAPSLHPITVPQSNGRLGLSSPRLQSLSKKTPEGVVLRSALTASAGHLLVACDYNACEARIAADLSGDPVLVQASLAADLFVALAAILFQDAGLRDLAKTAFYAILFGQTKAQFVKKQHALAPARAESVFDAATKHLGTLLAFRSKVHDQIDASHFIETRGGWRRLLHGRTRDERRRHGFSALVQGTAADILRRVLRELEVQLAPFGAGVVHHVHDEVYVETPVQHLANVEQVVQAVMTTAPSKVPALITRVSLTVKPPRKGTTWADIA